MLKELSKRIGAVTARILSHKKKLQMVIWATVISFFVALSAASAVADQTVYGNLYVENASFSAYVCNHASKCFTVQDFINVNTSSFVIAKTGKMPFLYNDSVYMYLNTSALNDSFGNWSLDRPNYATTVYVVTVNDSMKFYVDQVVTGNASAGNDSMKSYVDQQILAANNSIVDYIVIVNGSMKSYVDQQIVEANNSMINYVLLNNASMKGYVDRQDVAANDSIKDYYVGSTYVDVTAGVVSLIEATTRSWLETIFQPLQDQTTNTTSDVSFNNVATHNITSDSIVASGNITGKNLTGLGVDSEVGISDGLGNYIKMSFRSIVPGINLAIMEGFSLTGFANIPLFVVSNGLFIVDEGYGDISLSFYNAVLDDFGTIRWDDTNDELIIEDVDTFIVDSDFAVTGDSTMGGELDMNNNNLTNINQLIAPDGSAIQFDAPEGFVNFSNTISVVNNQTLGNGSVVYCVFARTGTGEFVPIRCYQNGLNNSASFMRNSQMISGDLGVKDGLNLTNALKMWDIIGINPSFDYNTADQGAALGVQWGLETQKVVIHDDLEEGLLSGEGEFRWLAREGTDIDLYGGPVHIKSPDRLENVTFGIEDVTLFDYDWGGISTGTQPPTPFSETGDMVGSSTQEWSVRTDARCNNNPCSRAKGGNSEAIRGMDYNFSTQNISIMNLSFWYGSDNMDAGPADNFSVLMSNNSADMSWVLVWNDTETDSDINPPIFKVFNVPETMNNHSDVTLRFFHQATGNSEESFVGDVKVNGTAGQPVTIEVTRHDASIKLGGSLFSSTQCEIFYNDSTNTIEIGRDVNCDVNIFNATFTTINVDSQNVTGSLDVSENITTQNISGDTASFNDIVVDTIRFRGSNSTINKSCWVVDNGAVVGGIGSGC